VTSAPRAIVDRQDATMAARVECSPGQRVRRRLFAIWAAVLLFTWTLQEFGKHDDVDRAFFMLGWILLMPLLAVGTAIVALFRGSWKTSLRSLGSSSAFAVASIAAMFGIDRACHGLGLGHWPPRDAVFVQRFRDDRAVWTKLRDEMLLEARSSGADVKRETWNLHHPCRPDARYVWESRFGDVGVTAAWAEWNGHWIELALWEGTIHHHPIGAKGLLYVDPALAGAPEARLVDECAVEDLGDGWYVYEE